MILWLLFADFVDEWLGWLPAGLLAEFRATFGLGYAKVSLVLVAHLVGGYAGSAVGGVLADVWDRRRLLLGGAALGAAGFAIASAATSVGWLLLGCLCVGLASGPVVHTAQLLLVDRARGAEERLEKPLGRFNALGSVGDLLGPGSLALALGAGFLWRVPMAAAAAVMATYGLGLSVLARRAPTPTPTRADEASPWPQIRATLTDRRLLRLALALALLDGLDEPFAAFVLLVLRDVAGVSPPSANLAMTVLVGSPLAGFALASRLGWPRARAMVVSLTALALGVAGFLGVPGMVFRIGCLALVGVSTAVFYTAALAEALSLRPDNAGTVTTVLSLVGPLSLVFAPLVGRLADSLGLAPAMAVYAALPLVMLLLVRKRLPR